MSHLIDKHHKIHYYCYRKYIFGRNLDGFT